MKLATFIVPRKTGALALLALAMTLAFPAQAQNALTPEQWREDLKYLAVIVPKAHRNAFHSISQDSFTAAVAEIDQQIPSMSDHDVMVAMARLVAMLGDGHSRVSLPGLIDPMSDRPSITPAKDATLTFHQLPVKLRAFSNGLFVVAATSEYKELLGAQVLQIGAYPAQKALQAVYPIVNRDNQMGLSLLAPHFVAVPEVLRAQQVVQNASQIPIAFQTRDGKKVSTVFTPLAPAAHAGWNDALEGLGIPQPLRLRDLEKNYWFEYLPDSKTVFVRINVIEDSRPESIAQFARRLHSFVESNSVDRAVLDLRDCHGGDNQMFRSLLVDLIREAKIDQPGKLFVIIGRNTFSAAVNAASDLERLCDCIFVGEPTVGSPSSYGDAHLNTLPNSGLVIRLSTVYWRDWTGDESRPWIAPDISVAESSEDYFAGKDPSLQAILLFPKDAGFADALLNVVRAGGSSESVMRIYYRQKTDPRSANESTRDAMQRLGAYFLASKLYKQALLAFQINARDYPNSVAAALEIVDEARSKSPQDEALADFAKKLANLQSKR